MTKFVLCKECGYFMQTGGDLRSEIHTVSDLILYWTKIKAFVKCPRCGSQEFENVTPPVVV